MSTSHIVSLFHQPTFILTYTSRNSRMPNLEFPHRLTCNRKGHFRVRYFWLLEQEFTDSKTRTSFLCIFPIISQSGIPAVSKINNLLRNIRSGISRRTYSHILLFHTRSIRQHFYRCTLLNNTHDSILQCQCIYFYYNLDMLQQTKANRLILNKLGTSLHSHMAQQLFIQLEKKYQKLIDYLLRFCD